MKFVAPDSKVPLHFKNPTTLTSVGAGPEFRQIDGIWRMLSYDRLCHYEPFVQDYETVRQAEGRGSDDPNFYQNLPFTSIDHPAADMWHQRALSYQTLLYSVLKPAERVKSPLTLLDMGAGNGWLSNRLAARGHTVAAVDLTVNTFDGLGVHTIYKNRFEPIQAEFDQLPLEDDQFDGVIFNASFHYSTDYSLTLAEAFRVTKPNGFVAIVDTPVYDHHASGQQMVAEREAKFEKAYGFKSNKLASENYLTHIRIVSLEDELGVTCNPISTVPLLRQAVRRLKTMVRDDREAAQFPILLFRNQQKESA